MKVLIENVFNNATFPLFSFLIDGHIVSNRVSLVSVPYFYFITLIIYSQPYSYCTHVNTNEFDIIHVIWGCKFEKKHEKVKCITLYKVYKLFTEEQICKYKYIRAIYSVYCTHVVYTGDAYYTYFPASIFLQIPVIKKVKY